MLTRRIAIGACALCLATPAAAGASEGTNPPRNATAPTGAPSIVTAKGPYGIPAPGARSTVHAKGPYGIPAPGAKSTVHAKGPYGIPAPGPRSTVRAKGPYGIPASPVSPSTPATSVLAGRTPLRDEASGWRTAAISEAALLAALLLGLALLLPARQRARHMAT